MSYISSLQGFPLLTLVDTLERRVDDIVFLYCQHGFDSYASVYPEWTAKDVLAHIVFWHESFARSLESISGGGKATPPKGNLRVVNQQGVDDRKQMNVTQLLRAFEQAQETISRLVTVPDLGPIQYRDPGRSMAPDAFVIHLYGHISRHYQDVLASQLQTAAT